MSAATDTPGFPEEFHAGLVDLAVSDLLAQERETSKALRYWDRGMGYGAELRQYVGGRQRLAGRNVL
jgi:hypothetical protein